MNKYEWQGFIGVMPKDLSATNRIFEFGVVLGFMLGVFAGLVSLVMVLIITALWP